MVKNTKTWISRERNVIFLWNKKILNLYLRWHILRIYRYVLEITFKWKPDTKVLTKEHLINEMKMFEGNIRDTEPA